MVTSAAPHDRRPVSPRGTPGGSRNNQGPPQYSPRRNAQPQQGRAPSQNRASRQLAVSRDPEVNMKMQKHRRHDVAPHDEERPFLGGNEPVEEGWTVQHVAAACVTFALAAVVTTLLYLYVYAGSEQFHTTPPSVNSSVPLVPAGGLLAPQATSPQTRAPPVTAPALMPQPGTSPKPASSTPAPVIIEVYYGTTCRNCQNFVSEAIGPLLDAGLTGDQVKINILPWIPEWRDDTECRMQLDCTFALAPLCALKGTFPEAMPIDAPLMQKAGRFVACDLTDTAADSNPPRNARKIEMCAMEAGLEAATLKTCADGPEGLGILHSSDFQEKTKSAHARIKKISGEVMAPFIFLNGNLMHCLSPMWCKEVWNENGNAEPLANPGSFFYIVCSKLDPKPDACSNIVTPKKVSKGEEDKMVEKAHECHNC